MDRVTCIDVTSSPLTDEEIWFNGLETVIDALNFSQFDKPRLALFQLLVLCLYERKVFAFRSKIDDKYWQIIPCGWVLTSLS